MTLRSGSSSRSPRMRSSSSSFGLIAAVGIEDRRRVADHAHAGEPDLQLLEFLRQQRSPLRLREQTGGLLAVVLVADPLLVGHRDEVVLHRAARQLALDVRLAPAQHDRRDALAQLGEVLVVDRPAALVELVERRG